MHSTLPSPDASPKPPPPNATTPHLKVQILQLQTSDDDLDSTFFRCATAYEANTPGTSF